MELTIAVETVCRIVLRAREYEVLVPETDPDEGSNGSDDKMVDALEDDGDNPAEAELRAVVGDLGEEEVAEVNALAQRQAQKLAAKPISSLIETKRLMKKANAPLLAECMAEEGASFGRMLAEPAAQEAFTAFMQKRKPDFSAV